MKASSENGVASTAVDPHVQNSVYERKLRAKRALEIATEHPEWTGEQVRAQVKEDCGMGISHAVLKKILRKARGLPAQRQNKGAAERLAYAKSIKGECGGPTELVRKVKEHFGRGIGVATAGRLFGREYSVGGDRLPVAAPLKKQGKGDEEDAVKILLEAIPNLHKLEVHEDGRVTIERRTIVVETVRYK